MDKHAINKFAVQARRDLITSVTSRLVQLGITETGAAEKEARSTAAAEYYAGTPAPLEGKAIQYRADLVKRLNELAAKNDWQTAYHDLIEEVAYTWFNRIIAIRFMEINDYLPSGTRVLSSLENRNEPDIMFDALDLEDALGGYSADDLALIQKAQELQQPTDLDAMYQMLFVKQVNKLHESLPKLFEKTDDFMSLLFTPSYNRGVIKDLVEQIPEADFDIASDDSQGQVEIIGWLYQYYNQEPHHEVVDINGGPVKEHDIPAATQLFTTDWVVRYMVDNSLGRYYLEHAPESQLAEQLKYLLPGELHPVDSTLDLASLHVLDNAMGSGHILVYAFDVLMKIYEEQGYSQREAAQQIATSNLFGLEIDKRAYQLAYFATMMKVRQYDRRALRRELKLNLYVFEDSKNLNDEFLAHLAISDTDRADLMELRDLFLNAKTLGSIMHFEHSYDIQGLLERLDSATLDSSENLFLDETNLAQLRRMLNVVGIMQAHYEVVVTNPPYLNKMNKTLKDYVKKYHKAYSGDLFSVFIWLNINMTVKNGYAAYMTPFVWMFIKTYEALRINILDTKSISSLIQMEYSAFEEATVPINTFVLKNSQETMGSYIKLSDFKGGMNVQRDKVLEALSNPECSYLYRANQANFEKIPGSPIAYWAPQQLFDAFRIGIQVGKLVTGNDGIKTGNNNLFLRQWFEVNSNLISTNGSDNKTWVPIAKGGPFRKWYGNINYVILWKNNGQKLRSYTDTNGRLKSAAPGNEDFFKAGLTWSDITSGKFSMRVLPSGSLFETSGKSVFLKTDDKATRNEIFAVSNSKVGNYILELLNPTIHMKLGDYIKLPLLVLEKKADEVAIVRDVEANVDLTKGEWDSSEKSRGFVYPPLFMHIAEHNRNWTVEAAFNQWSKEAEDRFNQLKSNEEELNRIFIDLYGLQDELTPEVADKDVSVRKADRPRDIKAFLSYFVGVVFGRYSLDVPGLAFAGGEWNASKYKTFLPNKDDIILLTDDDYFDDDRDIIHRLKEFLTVTFGAEHLDENLAYVADSLDKKGDTPEAQIRKYFMDDFYKKDHLSTYQKRPIYWQLTSGKNNGFKALMYLHRYDENTLAMIRTTYLHPLQEAYVNRRTQLAKMIEVESNTRQRNQMTKSVTRLDKQIDEIAKYDTSLQHVANMHIVLDLDDGVLVNHEKAQGGQKLLSPLK